MNKITYLVVLLAIFTVNTPAFAHNNKFCDNIYAGVKYGQKNHSYIFAKKIWERLNFHNIEQGKTTVSFNNNADTSTFYKLCIEYSNEGKSRVITVAKIYSIFESMRKSLDDMAG